MNNKALLSLRNLKGFCAWNWSQRPDIFFPVSQATLSLTMDLLWQKEHTCESIIDRATFGEDRRGRARKPLPQFPNTSDYQYSYYNFTAIPV